MIRSLIVSLAPMLVTATALAASPTTQKITFKNAKGAEAGTATLTQLAQGVRITIDAKDLTPGEHAFHFHENGKCEGPKFDSAGSHYAPEKKAHGHDDAAGPHAGDMPNLIVGADGKVKSEVINTHVSLKPGANSLLKKGGTALIIHEKADDYKTQPSGGAGGRVLCAEIKGA